jgi:hypothetical protein
MLIILLAFYGVGLFLAIYKPNAFFIYYLLASTKFLGFLDPGSFIIGGIELGYFGLNIIALFSIFFKKDWPELPKNSVIILLLIPLITCYGILRPIMNNYSTVVQAFIASKEAWYYSVFIYLIVYYESIDVDFLIKFLKGISIYFTIIYCLYFVAPNIIPSIYNEGSHVRTFFPTYISLAVFFYLVEIKMNKVFSIKIFAIISFLFLGLILAAHSSLTIMTLFCGIIYLFFFDENLELEKGSIIKLSFLILFSISLALLYVNGLYEGIIDKINSIVNNEDVALKSREIYNEFRWKAIYDQKLFGYGYVHKSSSFMDRFKLGGTSIFMERLTVIDSGYVDLFLKYGYLGTAILLFTFCRYFFLGFFKKYRNHFTLAMSLYFLQYGFINYTWSVYTFAHGIIPGAIAFYVIIIYQDFKGIENKLE